MTVAKLMKLLSKCNPRAKVCVYKDTFSHALDEVAIHGVDSAEEQAVPQCNDDGGLQHGPNGNERYKQCVVLFGHGYDPEKHG
jgi:hypothetical protein